MAKVKVRGQRKVTRGIVVHHTAGTSLSEAMNEFRRTGKGVHAIIDRDGTVYELAPRDAITSHTKPSGSYGAYSPRAPGLSNSNTYGIEIVASNNTKVNAAQIEAAKGLINSVASEFGLDPATQVYGHGELTPGHRQLSEGMAVVQALRTGVPNLMSEKQFEQMVGGPEGWLTGNWTYFAASMPTAGVPVPPAEVSSLGSRTLKKGMTGPNVEALQRALNGLGYNVDIDGKFGPQTEAALKAFQAAAGLTPDGVVGQQSRPLLAEASIAQSTAPIPRANPAFAPPDLQTALNEAAAREAELRAAPRVSPLNITAVGAPGAVAETRMSVSPVSLAGPRDNLAPPHIGPGPLDQAPRTSAAPVGPVERGPSLPDITPRLASARDNFAPPHIGPDPDPLGLEREMSQSRAQMDAMRQAIDEGWSVKAARIRSGMDQPNPVPRANPLRDISIGANSPLADTSLDTIGDSRFSDIPRTRMPTEQEMRATLAAQNRGMSIDDTLASLAGAPRTAPQDVGGSPFGLTNTAPDLSFAGASNAIANAPKVSAASAQPALDPYPSSWETSFPGALGGIQMNFGPAAGFDYAGAADILASAPRTAATGLPAGAVNMAQNTALPASAPVYQPTSPVGGPTLDELAYGAMPPGAAAASAAPVGKKPGMISNILSNPLARAGIGYLTGGPLGAAIGLGGALLGGALKGGGFGALGGGFDPATAARNAAYAAGVSQSDMIGGRYGGASYGRTGSDGVTRGTTSGGTGWSSSNGGKNVSVGGKSYTERRDGKGYSVNI